MTIVLVGFIVGICISYSGVGAGSLTTPLIIFLLGYSPSTAIGSDLLFSLGTKLVAVFAHVRNKTIDYGALLWLSAGGVPGALFGVAIVGTLRAHLPLASVDHALKIALGIVLIVAAAITAFGKTVKAAPVDRAVALPRAQLAIVGFIVGTTVSLTSIGSGSLTLPLLMLMYSSVALRRLVSTDIAFAVVVLVPAIAGHLSFGDVNLRLTGLLLAGSVPGVFVGARIAGRLPERAFRIGLAVVLVAVGAKALA